MEISAALWAIRLGKDFTLFLHYSLDVINTVPVISFSILVQWNKMRISLKVEYLLFCLRLACKHLFFLCVLHNSCLRQILRDERGSLIILAQVSG